MAMREGASSQLSQLWGVSGLEELDVEQTHACIGSDSVKLVKMRSS